MVRIRYLSSVFHEVQGPGQGCGEVQEAVMTPAHLPIKAGSSQCNRPEPGPMYKMRPQEITWRGIVARTDFIIQQDHLLLVGVHAVTSRGKPVTPLDRLNGEIAALIAAKQPQFRKCRAIFVALVHRSGILDLWHCKLNRIQFLLRDYYFAQSARKSTDSYFAPTAVVSFVIQQRQRMNFFEQTRR